MMTLILSVHPYSYLRHQHPTSYIDVRAPALILQVEVLCHSTSLSALNAPTPASQTRARSLRPAPTKARKNGRAPTKPTIPRAPTKPTDASKVAPTKVTNMFRCPNYKSDPKCCGPQLKRHTFAVPQLKRHTFAMPQLKQPTFSVGPNESDINSELCA